MTEEQYCYHSLAELLKSYERAAKPYIDRLVEIKSLQPAPYSITLTLDQQHAALAALRPNVQANQETTR